jgi:hypothetical protein
MVLAAVAVLDVAPAFAALPDRFDERFATVCQARGRPAAWCACAAGAFKRAIDDDHLASMIDYFEDPERFDERLAALETDATRLRVLMEEIEDAVAAARKECSGR